MELEEYEFTPSEEIDVFLPGHVMIYLENEKRLERDDRLDQRQADELARLPDLLHDHILPSHCCFPLDTFNLSQRTQLPDRLNPSGKIRIWRNMKADTQFHEDIPQSAEKIEPSMWPCSSRDLYDDQLQMNLKNRRKLLGILPCQDLFPGGSSIDNFAYHKELGHARIPITCPSDVTLRLVDRASGNRPGLVDGDYVSSELASDGTEHRIYTHVCLKGLKGMHLIELRGARAREKTWKFCFYQGLVALLAKTQLRYKYATSANLDYIYDHAWTLFLHIGSLPIEKKLQLDDIVVYNYKYTVEIKLESELLLEEFPKASWTYFEPTLLKIKLHKRPELMKLAEALGWEKINYKDPPPIHELSQPIEDFLLNIPETCSNFIIRTSRFALAIWKDSNFWYTYNPYRTDSFGYWDDHGTACMMKFPSKYTLIRHLVLLLLRAYAYEPAGIRSPPADPEHRFQLFKVTYACARIHNLRILNKQPGKAKVDKVWKDEEIKPLPEDYAGPAEKLDWIKKHQITWSKCGNASRQKSKWHEYLVEEADKVFSLWGEIHPTETIFSMKNRGKQVYACYVVAAGMSRIMAPEYWNSKTLDTIVMCGDRYYTLSRLQSDVTTENCEYVSAGNMHLLRHFSIGDILFEVDVMKGVMGWLYTEQSLWKILEQFFLMHSFGLLHCDNTCVGIFKMSGAYFMVDVDSVGPPIFELGDGVGYLVRVTSFRKFVVMLVLSIGSVECSVFHLHPVEIVKIVDVGK